MSKKYRSLTANIVLSSMILYTFIGDFPDTNKILAICLAPMCLVHLNEWIRRYK